MKALPLFPIFLSIAAQAANLYPLEPAEELDFPGYGYQHALIANDARQGGFAFLAAGQNGLVQFQGHRYDATSKRWVNQWESKTATEIGLPTGIAGLARSKELFLAVSDYGDVPVYATSTDGSNWTSRPGTEPGWMKSLAYGDGTWVATGTRVSGSGRFVGQIQFSKDDGATWQSVLLGEGETLFQATWNGSLWVAVGENRKSGMGGAFLETRIYTSLDGATWTLCASPGTVSLNGVVWGHGKWVAVGESYPFRGTPFPIILNSPDGLTWTDVSPKASREGGAFYAVDTTLHGFVAVGDHRVLHSYDGVQWEPVYENPQAIFRAVKSTPFEHEGSRIYLLADTGRAFQDTLFESPSTSSLRPTASGRNALNQVSELGRSVPFPVVRANSGRAFRANGRTAFEANRK